jgi:hypothetical protein
MEEHRFGGALFSLTNEVKKFLWEILKMISPPRIAFRTNRCKNKREKVKGRTKL